MVVISEVVNCKGITRLTLLALQQTVVWEHSEDTFPVWRAGQQNDD